MAIASFVNNLPAGLYHLPVGRKKEFSACGQPVFEISLNQAATAHEVLDRLGKTCNFPDWYGNNFDALHDCLTDPEWPAASAPPTLLIDGLDRLRHDIPETFSTLIDVLRSACENRAADARPLRIVLTTPARGVPDLPGT